MRRRAALAALAVLPLACVRGRRASGEALELVVPTEPSTLDPRFVADVYALRISRLLHVALVAPDPDTAAPVPWLAESLDDEPDGAVVVTLRRDARFHDGTALTAADVVATFRALGDERLAAPARRVVSEFTTIEALDARRVRLRPRAPRATLHGDLDVAILKADEAARPRGAPLTGSGPFRLAARAEGEISLVPASTYAWFAPPPRRELVVRTVRDEAARAVRIMGGRVDVASNVLSPGLALSLPARADAPAGLVAVRRPSAATTFLAVQCARPELAPPEVRCAISAAIDRAAIVSAKLGDAATLARGYLPPNLPWAAPDARPFPYDPVGAASVLRPLGRRGVRLGLATTTDRARIGIARAIAQALTDAGLPTEVRTYELGTLLARLSAGEFDVAPLVASEVTDPDVLRWYLHGNALPPRGANRARLRSSAVDALLDRGLSTREPVARRGTYAELERLLREQLPYVPLWHEDHVALTSGRAAAFRPSLDGRWGALAAL